MDPTRTATAPLGTAPLGTAPLGTAPLGTARAVRDWLAPHLPADGLAWLDEAAAAIAAGGASGASAGGADRGTAGGVDRVLFARFGAVPRKLGRAALPPHEGLGLLGWSADQAGRVALLLHRPADAGFLPALDRLFAAADLGEQVCLYRALPLLPWPERHRARAAEGIRSSVQPVFDAVALGNPYPADWLEEGAWNQMVLKAIFVGSPLRGITGLDRRVNPALARMLVDYARERRAAKRPVTPELWRAVGPHAVGERALGALRDALADPDPAQQRAAALALAASTDPDAAGVLASRPDLAAGVAAGRIGWESV